MHDKKSVIGIIRVRYRLRHDPTSTFKAEIGESNGVELFVADAWFHGAPDSPARLLDEHGYETVRTRSIADREEPCPKCEGRCVCEAALVVRV